MQENCIFCKIVNKEIVSSPIYEDDHFVVIPDKFPKAPIHFLLIPKEHITSIAEARDENLETLGKILLLGRNVANDQGIADFKLVFNAGRYLEVPHLHLHLMAGWS